MRRFRTPPEVFSRLYQGGPAVFEDVLPSTEDCLSLVSTDNRVVREHEHSTSLWDECH